MPRAKKTIPVPEAQRPVKAVTKPKPIQSVARLAKKNAPSKPPLIVPEQILPPVTKTSQILALLHLPQGASLAELQTAIGW